MFRSWCYEDQTNRYKGRRIRSPIVTANVSTRMIRGSYGAWRCPSRYRADFNRVQLYDWAIFSMKLAFAIGV
jgi:hypothetical protein